MYEIKTSPGKGLGVFALQDLPAATLLLSESPLIESRPWDHSTSDIKRQFDKLTKKQQKKYMALHSSHNPNFPHPATVYQLEYLLGSPLGVKKVEAEWKEKKSSKATPASAFHSNALSWNPKDGNIKNDQGTVKVVLGLECSRFNNSCLASAIFRYNEDASKMKIVLLRAVKTGEVSYEPCKDTDNPTSFAAKHNKRIQQAKNLADTTYDDMLYHITKSSKERERRERQILVDYKIGIELYKQAGLMIPDVATCCSILLTQALKHQDYELAKWVAGYALFGSLCCLGPSAPATIIVLENIDWMRRKLVLCKNRIHGLNTLLEETL